MTNSYLTFLDYLEIRRQIEKRLTSGKVLLIHTIIFTVCAFLIGILAWAPNWQGFRDYFIRPTYGEFVAVWSGVLFAHGFIAYWQSGAHGERRDEVIEQEMRERVEHQGSFLSDHPDDLFQLHDLLNKDIQKRASMIPVLTFFLFLNALMWIPWAFTDARTAWAWTNAPILILPLFFALLINFLLRTRHSAKMRRQREAIFYQPARMAEYDYEPEREIRLSEDELVTVDEYMIKRKRG